MNLGLAELPILLVFVLALLAVIALITAAVVLILRALRRPKSHHDYPRDPSITDNLRS